MKDSTVIYAIALMSLCVMGTIANMGRAQFIGGRNDFVPLYTGPLLLKTGELYDNASLLAKERAATGLSDTTKGYIRPPFVAALMWPLSHLPYYILSLAVVAAAWTIARRSGFIQTFGAALIGRILLARHSYTADLLLVLPGCLALIALSKTLILRILAVVLLLPPAAFAIQFSATGSLIYTLALFTLLAGWAWETQRTPTAVTHEVQA